MLEVYKKWLPTLKLRLSISDPYRDQILTDYLKIAHTNLWQNYYELELDQNNQIPETHEWSSDTITKMAVIHLAVTYYSNPDINLEATNVKDDKMVIRIIGSRMVY